MLINFAPHIPWVGLLKVNMKKLKRRDEWVVVVEEEKKTEAEENQRKVYVIFVGCYVLLHFEARATTDNTFNTLILTWIVFCYASKKKVLKGVYLLNICFSKNCFKFNRIYTQWKWIFFIIFAKHVDINL